MISGLFLISMLLIGGALFSFVMAGLTLSQYIESEFANEALIGSSMRIGIGIVALILAFGISKRYSWTLYASIIFIAFSIINSIWNIIVSAILGLDVIFGIIMLMLFSMALYYIIRKRDLFN